MIKRIYHFSMNIAVAIFGFFFLLWLLAIDWPARKTGDWFPVVGKLNIQVVESFMVGDRLAMKIIGNAEKYRSCDFNKMTWYVRNDHGAMSELYSTFTDKPRVNGVGVIQFEGIVVGISTARLAETYAEVTHSCKGFKTITEFYEGELSD